MLRLTFIIFFFIFLDVDGNHVTQSTARPNSLPSKEYVCFDTDIRNTVSDFKRLENCTVIEGHLQIVLIETDDESAFRKLSFPNLREITSYLLLYHIRNLKTLSNIFPNLSVIRGRQLIYNYAFVIYELPSLEDIGMASLTLIERGAVRIERNPQLCYLETIDWNRLIQTKTEKNTFMNNRLECSDGCPQDAQENSKCSSMDVYTKLEEQLQQQPLCWNSASCQILCSSECSAGACFKRLLAGGRFEMSCCHSDCVGGCYGPSNADCSACKDIYHNGVCQKKCPAELYQINGRRCVTANECWRTSRIMAWKVFNNSEDRLCLVECPSGFMEDPTQKECVKCPGLCPKACRGRIIDSIQSAQEMTACTVINGALEIHVRGGNPSELTASLGNIQVVRDYIRVIYSYAITSLEFLKSLELIKGEKLYNGMYSLFIHANQNLEMIWDLGHHPELTIRAGKVFFMDNKLLCTYRIWDFINSIGLQNVTDGKDVSELSNGNLGNCESNELTVRILSVNRTFVSIAWNNLNDSQDDRHLLGWVVHYRNISDDKSVIMLNGRDNCMSDVWITKDVPLNSTLKIMSTYLQNLVPFTRYVVYVQAYVVSEAKRGFVSQFLNFTTKASKPTRVRDLEVMQKEADSLLLTWNEPEFPFGIVTHYIITWYAMAVGAKDLQTRNSCQNSRTKILHISNNKTSSSSSSSSSANSPSSSTFSNGTMSCCPCGLSSQDVNSETMKKQLESLVFENHLHRILYEKGFGNLLDEEKIRIGEEIFPLNDSFSSVSSLLPLKKHENKSTANKTVNQEDLENWTTFNFISPVQTETRMMWTENTSALLNDLTHFQRYWIQVFACQGDPKKFQENQLCSKSSILSTYTKADDVADVINSKNVTVSITPSSSTKTDSYSDVRFSWLSPSNPNGVVLAFHIEISKVDHETYKPDVFCITFEQYNSSGHGYISKQLGSGNWSYRLRTLTLAGNGPWTPLAFFYIDRKVEVSLGNKSVFSALIIIPLILFSAAILSFFVIRRKRLLDHPIVSPNPQYVNPDYLYVADEWEVDRDAVVLLDALGQGSFGMVYRGLFTEQNATEPICVAVKTINENSHVRDRIAFLHEASVMKAFRSYHVVQLLGIVSKGQPTLVVMELMANGDLKTFLRRHRDLEENEGRKPPTTKQALQMAGEIADGMAYLSSRKFVHRDLAARNCMVADDLTVKIGDFGLTRDIYDTEYYRKISKGLLPVRWMAPESLKDGIFTSYSDVWSYGVVLWEIATMATQPYQGLSNEQVLHYVIEGGKMTISEGCPEQIFHLISICWVTKPDIRPTFVQIVEYLLPHLNSRFEEVSHFCNRNNVEETSAAETPNVVADDDDYNSKMPLNAEHKNVDLLKEERYADSNCVGPSERLLDVGFEMIKTSPSKCQQTTNTNRTGSINKRSSSYAQLPSHDVSTSRTSSVHFARDVGSDDVESSVKLRSSVSASTSRSLLA